MISPSDIIPPARYHIYDVSRTKYAVTLTSWAGITSVVVDDLLTTAPSQWSNLYPDDGFAVNVIVSPASYAPPGGYSDTVPESCGLTL